MPRNPRKQCVGKRRENLAARESTKELSKLRRELRAEWKASSAVQSPANSDADPERPAGRCSRRS